MKNDFCPVLISRATAPHHTESVSHIIETCDPVVRRRGAASGRLRGVARHERHERTGSPHTCGLIPQEHGSQSSRHVAQMACGPGEEARTDRNVPPSVESSGSIPRVHVFARHGAGREFVCLRLPSMAQFSLADQHSNDAVAISGSAWTNVRHLGFADVLL